MKISLSDVEKIANEAVKIYFDYDVTAKEAVERAKKCLNINNQ